MFLQACAKIKKKKVIVARSIDSQVQAVEWKEQPSGNRNDLTHRKCAANPLKYSQSHVDLSFLCHAE